MKLIDLFDECYGDHLYLCALADQLEEEGDIRRKIAVRLLADEVYFLVYDDRLRFPGDDCFDLFGPADGPAFPARYGLVWRGIDDDTYTRIRWKFRGMRRTFYKSPTAALNDLAAGTLQ